MSKLEELKAAEDTAYADWKAAGYTVEELEQILAKALEALGEAVYLLDPDEKDMARKAGVYRVVTTLAELKGQEDD